MQRAMKFGRKLPIPSLVQIKHDLRMMSATDALVEAMSTKKYTPEDMSLLLDSLKEKYGISPDRAQKLSNRFGVSQGVAPVAAS
ncbi:hypothetical protein [Methylobacterium nigriterrae]|uniref:hypothetical protein n=1 Tax=Methylobacterium nigriterrae TaxID=3127512 RepID=UPI003013D043